VHLFRVWAVLYVFRHRVRRRLFYSLIYISVTPSDFGPDILLKVLPQEPFFSSVQLQMQCVNLASEVRIGGSCSNIRRALHSVSSRRMKQKIVLSEVLSGGVRRFCSRCNGYHRS
jgi:hypothetical protein